MRMGDACGCRRGAGGRAKLLLLLLLLWTSGPLARSPSLHYDRVMFCASHPLFRHQQRHGGLASPHQPAHPDTSTSY
jgi:hypothetical protein